MPDEPLLHPTSSSDNVAPAAQVATAASNPAVTETADTPRADVQIPPGEAGTGGVGQQPAPEQELEQPEVPVTTQPDAEQVENYSNYKVGDLLDGIKIHHILLQYADAIVFTTSKGSIHFRQNIGPRADAVLVEFYRLTARSTARLKQAYARQINSLLGAALAEALSLPEAADLRSPFKAIDEFIDEVGPIRHVFGANDAWVVFIDKDGELVCEYPEVTDQSAPLLTEFYRLRQLGQSSLLPSETKALCHILGTELSIALQRTSAIEPADAFSASRDYIQLRNESRMRARYVSASVGAAVAAGVAAWLLVRSDLGLLLGCAGGIIGAAISVLQRSADLEIRRFLPAGQVVLQGTVRVTLGILFALLIVAAARANLALGSFAATENALFIAGAIAGFSERFVPDLLTKMASADNQAAKK